MTTPIYGVDEVFFSRIETVFDEITNDIANAIFVGADAMGLVSLDFAPTLAFTESEEKTSDPDLVTEIKDKQGGTWTGVAYFKPGAVGVAPDIDPMLLAGFGDRTIVGGTSVEYILDQVQPASLLLAKRNLDGSYEVVSGAWIETIVFSITGGAIPTMTFTGGFASYGFMFGAPQTDNAGYNGVGTVTLDNTGDAKRIRRGAVIAFGSEDNGGAGYTVTDRDTSAETIDFLPVLANPLVGVTNVVPFNPTPVLTGTILGAINDNVVVDGTSLGNIAYTGTLTTGIHALDREHTTDRPNRIGRGTRRFSADMEFYFLNENVADLGAAWDGNITAINCRVGPAVAAQRATLKSPAARLNVAQVVTPADVEATWVGNHMNRTAAAANDMFSMIFD